MAQKDVKFTEAMNRLFHEVFTHFGSGHSILETIVDNFSDDENEVLTDEEYIPAYKYDERGMFYLLYELMNWDCFWVKPDGTVDIENANEPEMAEIVAPYISPSLGLKVLLHFQTM